MAEGAVLVIGGCGFVGFHVVKALLEVKSWSSVHVMSRNPARNQLAGAFYHVGDMTSAAQVRTLLDEIRPSVVIHNASPIALGNAEDWQYWYRTNVGGTKNVLDCAAAGTYVKAFVYTSSVSIIDKASFDYVDETAPMATITSKLNYYSKSKALADQYVLDSNNKTGLRTTCLRITSVYGTRDNQMIPGAIQALHAGHQRKQIGDNTNLYDACSVRNAATAHVLAAKALLRDQEDPLLKVDGEAFFITDGHPIPYWDFLRMIWAAAGDKTPLEEVQVIPAWFILGLASAVEWVYFVFTLGKKRPKMLRRFFIEHTCLQRTFSIEKARKRLGYTPVDDRDGMIRAAVEWELQKEVEAGKQKTS
ncbi:hypothetical protein JMJ35_003073 [Cladonia borealis]|uniref:3-beta hydroxysteroid dehydrogenase/isomerase domain-containing protein n=1 Tax=Cladonia borealis TaxID=184061 RepID=A0AA39R5K7_9LECA|nr:hypothetical protein JMJ35_003073 [Cladonia borealis]